MSLCSKRNELLCTWILILSDVWFRPCPPETPSPVWYLRWLCVSGREQPCWQQGRIFIKASAPAMSVIGSYSLTQHPSNGELSLISVCMFCLCRKAWRNYKAPTLSLRFKDLTTRHSVGVPSFAVDTGRAVLNRPTVVRRIRFKRHFRPLDSYPRSDLFTPKPGVLPQMECWK